MKKILMTVGIATLLAVFASPANALPVVEWVWELNTTGDGISDTQFAPASIDTGAPEYQYSWTITLANVSAQVDDPPIPPQDFSILVDVAPTNGAGSSNTLPITIASTPILIDLPEIGAKISLAVLSNGQLLAQLSNVDLRTLTGGGEPPPTYDVLAAKFKGTLHVEAVPEPATIALLGLGSVVLLGKRRRRASRS